MRYLRLFTMLCLVLTILSGCKVKEAAGAYRPAKSKTPTTATTQKKSSASATSNNKANETVKSVNFNKPAEEPKTKAPEVKQPEPVKKEVVAPAPAAPKQEEKVEAVKEVTRSEKVSVVDVKQQSLLKDYSVVVGSFGSKANADRLNASLQAKYHPVVVINEKGMYRVIISSFDDYNSARLLINEIKQQYPDAWVLKAN